MIHYHPAVPIGTVSAESIRVFGVLPTEGKGLPMDGMDVFLAVEQAPGPTDYWIIELGALLGTGLFETRAQMARPQIGLAKGRNSMDFAPEVRYSTGEVVAVRVRPIGSPAALTGCDVVLRIQEP